MTANSSELEKVLQEIAERQSVGGPGGAAFTEELETRKHGEINEIRIWAGNAIDAIEVHYNGVPGRKHGGPGGNMKILTVPSGCRITEIDTWAGYQPHHNSRSYVLRGLRFIMSPISGGGASQTSEMFGLQNGDYRRIKSGKGLPLRSISGSAGVFVDGLSFDFGYLFEIRNPRLNHENIADRLKNARPVHHQTDEFKNGTSLPQSKRFSFNQNVANDYETYWGGQTSLMLGIKFGIEAGFELPGLEGKFTNEFTAQITQSFTYGERWTKREQTSYGYWTDVVAAPHTAVSVGFTIMEVDLDKLEVNYDVVFYESTPSEPHRTVPMSVAISGAIASRESITELFERPLPESADPVLS